MVAFTHGNREPPKPVIGLKSSDYWPRIMHHQTQLADLVDVLAVDVDIVDRLGDSRKEYAQN